MGQLANTPDSPDPVDPDPVDPVDDSPEPSRREQMAADLVDLTTPAPEPSLDPEPDAPTPDDPEPPVTPDDFIVIGGMEIPRDQEEAVAGLLQWAANLTEEQADLAFKAAAGEPFTPAPAVPDAPTVPDDLADTYPEVAAALARQQAEIEKLRSEIDPRLSTVEDITGQQAYESTQAQIHETEARVRDTFLKSKSLSDEDYTKLVETVGQLGVVPTLVEQFGLEDGFTRALNIAYASNPDMLAREAQQLVQKQQTTSRKERASALSPTGGSLPRTTPDPANLPISEKRRAMVDDINNIIGQG